MTSTSSLSSSSGAAPSPPAAAGAAAAATATGAAAVTPKVVSNSLTNSLSSIRVSSLNASRSSVVLSFAMMAGPFLLVVRGECRVGGRYFVSGGCRVGDRYLVNGGCRVGDRYLVNGGCRVGDRYLVNGGCRVGGVGWHRRSEIGLRRSVGLSSELGVA